MDDVELGSLLRTWRRRRSPAVAGLISTTSRHTPGLRREELAVLAGVSSDYIVRLEQGRFRTPSPQVCQALSRALELSDAEHAHLFALAGHADRPGTVSRLIPAAVQRIVDQLHDRPVVVYDAVWTRLAWNRLWAQVFGDPSELRGHDRNLVWRQFTDQSTRMIHTADEIEVFERAIVSDLRRAAVRYTEDREVAKLIDDLGEVSPRFQVLWDSHAIGHFDQGHKIVAHPEVGPIDLDCDVLASHRGDLRVLVYTTHDRDAQSKLDLLRAIDGTLAKPGVTR